MTATATRAIIGLVYGISSLLIFAVVVCIGIYSFSRKLKLERIKYQVEMEKERIKGEEEQVKEAGKIVLASLSDEEKQKVALEYLSRIGFSKRSESEEEPLSILNSSSFSQSSKPLSDVTTDMDEESLIREMMANAEMSNKKI